MEKIEIYIADTATLKDAVAFEKKLSLLQHAEQILVLQKRKEEDRCNTLGALLLLRYALMTHGIDTFEIAKDQNGKPYLVGETLPFFNLSHSRDRAMCVLSDRAVGCDVQWMDPKISLGVADRFFSNAECALIRSEKNEEAQRLMFYRLWTLKESFVKMTGEGVLRAFHTFSVLPGDDNGFYFCSDCEMETPCFFEPCTEEHYRYALCAERGFSVSTQWMDLASFL